MTPPNSPRIAGPTVLVVGSGIGGLATAIALRRAGVDAVLYERSGDLRKVQVGAGILVEQNAMRALRILGLDEQIQAVGMALEAAEHRTSSGKLMAHWPVRELSEKIGAPAIAVSRANLHRVLADALKENNVHLGAECVGFEQDGGKVTARFADGRVAVGDALIGADGLRSTIRVQLLGQSKPRYAGYTLWQGTAAFDTAKYPLGLMRMVWGKGGRFVSYYTSPGQLFWFGVANAPEGGTERKEKALARFRGWMQPIEELIAATPESSVSRVDMFDRDPVSTWGVGRVTLLGDAAHPITVNAGQGAAQTLEDAVVLAKRLREHSDVITALRAYEESRMKRTAHFIMLARRIGDAGRMANPLAVLARDAFIRLTFGSVAWKAHSADMAYQFDG